MRGCQYRMLVDAGGDTPARPEIHQVWLPRELVAGERFAVERRQAPGRRRLTDERRGDLARIATEPREEQPADGNDEDRHQQPSERAHHAPSAVAAGTGWRCSTATSRRARSGHMAKTEPMPTTRPPIQIQTTSGLTNRWSVTVPVAGSDARRVTYRSSASEVRTAGVAMAVGEFG